MQRLRCKEQPGQITYMGSTGCQGVRDIKGAEAKSANRSKVNTPCTWYTNDNIHRTIPHCNLLHLHQLHKTVQSLIQEYYNFGLFTLRQLLAMVID